MIYDHMVRYNGIYYEAGEDVPIEEVSLIGEVNENEEIPFSDEEIEMENEGHIYTYEELEKMTAKQMRKIAEDNGFRLVKVTKDDLINEFLSKQ